MRRLLLLYYALCCYIAIMAGDRKVKCFEYWIDSDVETRTTVNTSYEEIMQAVDASTLSEGIHVLHYRVQDDQGCYSPLYSWTFYRTRLSSEIATIVKEIEYWFDDGREQAKRQTASQGEVNIGVDASDLREGLHTLYYRPVDDIGRYGSLCLHKFYRTVPRKTGSNIIKYRIWWNNYEDKAIEVQLPGDAEYLYEETLTVPDYARDDGFSNDCSARFNIVFTDDKGNLSPIQSSIVYYKDVIPPITTVTVDKAETMDSVIVSWSSNEKSANIFNVYYSEENGPYILWKPNTTQQEALFRGQSGNTYKFIVTSHDSSGNYEAMEESKAISVELK